MSDPTSQEPLPPVYRSVDISRPPAETFRLFTEEIHGWWPLAVHSVGQSEAEHCEVEGRVGGRIYERTRGGDEHVWGTIRVWEPGERLVFSWHPGRPAETAQEVEVRVRETESGARLELEHRGWEILGDQARETRDGYDQGWKHVLEDDFGAYCQDGEASR